MKKVVLVLILIVLLLLVWVSIIQKEAVNRNEIANLTRKYASRQFCNDFK